MNPVTPLTPEQTQSEGTKATKDGYPRRVAVAFDVFVNVTTGGQEGETISARAGRASLEGKLWGKLVASALNLIQTNHCAKAQASDLARARNIAGIELSTGDLNKPQ